MKLKLRTIFTFLLVAMVFSSVAFADKPVELLNVSYDPTREFYQDYNKLFAAYWQKKTGELVEVKQSHGGSGKQARSVIDGLQADVVTLALAYDVDAIHENAKLLPADWEKQLPNNSAPYTSTIVFLVRKGNPKHIKDWNDLVKPGVQVITPNPKTSGGARWNFLAAWAYAKQQYRTDDKAKGFIKALFKNVPVLDSGARGATTTFVSRGLGDVLIAWENEALLVSRKENPGKYEIVYPSVSILAEPSVAVVRVNTEKHRTTKVAEAYLRYLYSEPAQDLIAKNYFRPRSKTALKQYARLYPTLKLVTISDLYKNWNEAQKIHFQDGGTFDQIYSPGAK
ncbi:sulfate ABC transporter substrate-binding protein [bacterium]|nr:sulfate ABC transporter substrate-binding protein [bacterium]